LIDERTRAVLVHCVLGHAVGLLALSANIGGSQVKGSKISWVEPGSAS